MSSSSRVGNANGMNKEVRLSEVCGSTRSLKRRHFDNRRSVGYILPEDIGQEAACRALQLKFDGKFFPKKGSFESFQRGVGKNVAREYTRRCVRETICLRSMGAVDLTDRSPIETLIDQDICRLTLAAIERLPVRDADVIKRRFGLTQGSRDASPLSRSERSRLSRALKRLRESMGDPRK